jgi:hypothetical protein
MSHHKDGGWIARGILLPDLLAKRLVNRMMSPRPEQGVSEGGAASRHKIVSLFMIEVIIAIISPITRGFDT